ALLHATLHHDAILHGMAKLYRALAEAPGGLLDEDDHLGPVCQDRTGRHDWDRVWGERPYCDLREHVGLEQTIGILHQTAQPHRPRGGVNRGMDGSNLGWEHQVRIGCDTDLDRSVQTHIGEVALVYICQDPHRREIRDQKQGIGRICPQVLPEPDFPLYNGPGNRGTYDNVTVDLGTEARYLRRLFAEQSQAILHPTQPRLPTPFLILPPSQ